MWKKVSGRYTAEKSGYVIGYTMNGVRDIFLSTSLSHWQNRENSMSCPVVVINTKKSDTRAAGTSISSPPLFQNSKTNRPIRVL